MTQAQAQAQEHTIDARMFGSPPGTWRLLLPALTVWMLTAAAIVSPGRGVWLMINAIGVGLTALLMIFVFPRARNWTLVGAVLLLCAMTVLLGARITGEEQTRADATIGGAAERGDSLDFDVRLASYPKSKIAMFGERHWVRAEALLPSGAVPVLLWLENPPTSAQLATWAPGMRFTASGRPERLAAGDDAAYAISLRELIPAVEQPLSARFGGIAASLRAGLRTAASAVPGAELVPGFAVGDTAPVTPELEQAMLASSLTHLTAVSGANCALVTGAVIWLLGRLRAGRRVRIIAAGVSLAGFVALIGPDASVQRAAVMAAVLLVSGFGGRKGLALPSLGLAVIVLLMLNPWQALQPGFALSVAATAGILLLATPTATWLHRRARLPRLLALPVAVAFAAQLACGPLLLLLQPGIPAVGVLANVIAAPAAPLGTGLGLIATLLGPVGELLSHGAVVLASIPARWVAATAELTASLPLARWHWPEGWTGAALLAVCQVGPVLAWAIHRGYLGLPNGDRVVPRAPWQPAAAVPIAVRRSIAVLLATSFGLFLAITLVAPAAERLSTPRGWAVVACDVGQGDALLLRDPMHPQQVVLVDTGDDVELLTRCLDRFGVRQISLLVLSHDDRDHVGALPDILERVERALIAPAVRGESHAARPVVRQLETAGVPYRVGELGDTGYLSGSTGHDSAADPVGLSWRVLGPATSSPPDSNAASLVLAVASGSVSTLLLGDTGAEEQEMLLRDTTALRATVLKVAHHGSRDQAEALPGAVGAAWALVSVGVDNRHGHPAGETLAELSRVGTRVLRTDLHGSIALVPRVDGSLVPWVEYAQRR